MRILVLVLLISLAFSICVYAEDEEPREIGFVEKTFIAIINSISSALDMEDLSIDHLIYGKSGTGSGKPSTWTKSKYAFNPVKGNLFFDIYRGSYGVFRNIGIMIINISVVYLATKGLYANAGSKDYFKAGVLALLGTTLLFTSLPGILDYILMVRESLLDFVYSLSASLSGVGGGGFIDGLRANASSDTATLQDALFYLAGVILNIYFVFIYISMGVSFVLCMWLSPILITTSENKVKEKVDFFKYIAGIVLTPVIDAALLIMPLVMVAKSEQTLITIATFAAIIPTRTWLRKQLGVGSGVSEMMGMGFAFMGGQMVGSAARGLVGAGKKLGQGVEHGQKASAFLKLAKEEEGFGDSAFSGFNQSQSQTQAEQVYGSINSNATDFGSFTASPGGYSAGGFAGGRGFANAPQTEMQAKMAAKYGHKGWFKETGIQMTNGQKAQSEAISALKSAGSATGGLVGRAGGMGVGATIFSGYSSAGVAAGASAGGEIGDAVGSRLGQVMPILYKTNRPDDFYSVDLDNYKFDDYEIDHDSSDMVSGGQKMLSSGEGNLLSGGSNVDYPLVGGGSGSRSLEVSLMDGYQDFKVRNESSLKIDYDNSVPSYASTVMDSNKTILLDSAMSNFASKNNLSKDNSMISSPVIRNKAHDVAKQQIVNDLVSGQASEQFRNDFAKQVHTQEVAKQVTGDLRLNAEELADKQLDDLSTNLYDYVENNYQAYILDYMQKFIIENEDNK
jgi:hypothetical protein